MNMLGYVMTGILYLNPAYHLFTVWYERRYGIRLPRYDKWWWVTFVVFLIGVISGIRFDDMLSVLPYVLLVGGLGANMMVLQYLRRSTNDADPLVADAASRALHLHIEPTSSDQLHSEPAISYPSTWHEVMETAVCQKHMDGSITIKSRKFRNIIILVIFGLCGACLGVVIIDQILSPTRTIGEKVFLAFGLLANVGGFIAYPSSLLIRSFRIPPIYIDPKSKMVDIGRGATKRQFPFSNFSRIAVRDLGKYRLVEDEHGEGADIDMFGLDILLNDGGVIELGKLSGNKAQERAEKIAHSIADVTGVSVDKGKKSM